MQTWPLESISFKEAMKKQFKLVENVTNYFHGDDSLTQGDLGVVPGLNKPETTEKAEYVIAEFFNSEAAMLVRGAGTTAIRNALYSVIKPNHTILIHDAPIYPTTQVSLDMLNVKSKRIDFNDKKALEHFLKNNKTIDGVLLQLTRQKPSDSYDSQEVIELIKETDPLLPVITDDNYAVMKIPNIGVEMGADLSCFSTFKLLGPEGVGCIVGKKEYITPLKKDNYSGGLQVQGHEALDVLRGMIYAPVALAISSQTSEEICNQLNNGVVKEVKRAFVANAQSKVVLIEFEEPIAKKVLEKTNFLGAAPYPVGAESKYEITPMFYRVSSTFSQTDPSLKERMIRVNPMRAGAETVLRILTRSIQTIEKE